MYLELNAPKITKMALVLPENSSTYEQDMAHLPEQKLKIAKENVGVNQRYFCDNETFTSDLAVYALNAVAEKREIDALMVVSVTPDYFMPKLSNIIAHKLNLSPSVLCIDNFNFCNGFVSALSHAAMLLEHCGRVAIVCADVASKIISQDDKQFTSITSDSASAVILEKSDEKMYFIEEAYLDNMMNMSTLVSAFKKGDEKLITNNNLVLKEYFSHFPSILAEFSKVAPKADFYFAHTASMFFQKTLEKQYDIEIFNESLGKYGCLYVNDIVANLALAKDKFNFANKTRAQFIGFGTGLTINMANMPIYNFDSKILFV